MAIANRFQPAASGSVPDQAFKQIADVVDQLAANPAYEPSTAGFIQVGVGQFRRLAPRAGTQQVVIPAASSDTYGKTITLLVENSLGAVRVRAVSGTINGASAFTLAAGYTTLIVLVSNGNGRWVTARAAGFPVAGPHLIYTGETLDVDLDKNFTWTGIQRFSGTLQLGVLHTEASVSGAFNITLTTGASRILVTSTGAATLGTISGAVDGRVCILEHVRASGAGDLTLAHSLATNGIACLNSANLTLLGNRSGALLVCRDDVWRVMSATN